MKTILWKTLLLSTLVSCGGGGAKREEIQGNVGGVIAARPAMKVPLAAITVRGELSVKQMTEWLPMIEGNTLQNVREVKTERRGAIVALGDSAEAPLLFLRAGTHVALTQDANGVHVAVLEGRARLRRGASVSAYIDTEGGEVIVSGDVLVDARPKRRADVRPTGVRPSAADWSFALQQPETGAGAGTMEARVGSSDKMEPVELRSVIVDVKTAGDQAITEVTHFFHNAMNDRREGTFRFPVPDGALLVGLAMEIEGKMVEGEVVEREKARAIYQKIVDEMLDPALLEWEQGNWFKLRVFPLEPKADKKVVIRYVTQMSRSAHGWEYDYSLGGQKIGAFSMNVDGKPHLTQKNLEKGVDLVVPIAANVPDVMTEKRADGIYTAVRIAPMLAAPPSVPSMRARNIAIVVDTSRSSLESRAQQLEVLETTVRQLAPSDRFMVIAADVEIQQSWPGYVAASDQAITQAKKMIESIEPDGASDLGNTFAALDARDPSQVIYIGDGIATWGETRTHELANAAKKIGAPIDAALVGKGASTALWSELSGETGGRSMVVKSELDEQRFALAATQADMVRLTNATIAAPQGSVMFPATAMTIVDGDEIVAVMKLPAGAPMPTSVKLTGTLAGQPYSEDIQLVAAVATDRVAQRWGRQMLAQMESTGAGKEEIVALSTELGVMSKYTSLLVLENDEMFKQYEIDRKKQREADALQLAQAPTVTGGDLDSLGARQASLSPDEIQPGDPEIKIPAPLDAQSVVVTFPFGETKLAVWDNDVDAWMVRFLIDQDTADGLYYARVTITHADGRIEVIQLPYTVDTKAPIITATAKKVGATYRIRVKQQREGTHPKDAERVEIVLPDGTIMKLGMTEWGVFEGDWTPASPLTGPLSLQVYARDNALNQSSIELVLQ
ncbi:MAG: VIT and vWA domain-containing protein [Kofleriaceae bacterium]